MRNLDIVNMKIQLREERAKILLTLLLLLGVSYSFKHNTTIPSSKLSQNVNNKTLREVFQTIEKPASLSFLFDDAQSGS